MNVLDRVKDALKQEIAAAALKAGFAQVGNIPVVLETPRLKEHGDYATNLAMQLTKIAKQPPRQIAQAIVDNLDAGKARVSQVEIAGPGFINFRMDKSYLLDIIPEILRAGREYGSSNHGGGRKVNIEFVSANPTGDLHVGHARNAAVGDSLSRIMAKAGYAVHREYYINDAGNQINNLALSLEARYLQALGQDFPMPQDGYHGADIIAMGRELAANEGEKYAGLPRPERLQVMRQYALEREIDKLRRDLADFGVEFDTWFSETSLYESGTPEAVLEFMSRQGCTYREGGAVWFRASEFGDDKDRVLVKQDGSYTYLMPDIAYHRNKLERGFETLINVWGADHHGYIPRLRAALKALGYEPDRLQILIMQMVNLFQDGEKIKMSKRTGKAVTLRDLLDEVGADAVRYFLTMLSADSPLDFDLDLAVSKSNDNPVFYVQYAHARLCSMEENAREAGLTLDQDLNLSPLDLEREYDLLNHLGEFPSVVAEAAERLMPHRVVAYVFELASQLHSYYNAQRVIDPDDLAASKARLALMKAVRITIANALDLIGVTAPEKM
ncbi:MAG: arginine--tRNA ligase [Bacillota bacterium]|jgi:arginyl-tRNA synthetase